MIALHTLKAERNKLQKLPKSIGRLENLRVLLLNENLLMDLPDDLGNLKLVVGLGAVCYRERGNSRHRLCPCERAARHQSSGGQLRPAQERTPAHRSPQIALNNPSTAQSAPPGFKTPPLFHCLYCR